jgi:PAS domain S-box-containing protein
MRFRVIQPGGKVRRLQSEWRVIAGADGRAERVSGIMMDDTEAYELALSVEDTRAQLMLAVELAQIGVWRHDLNTRRMYYNDRACQMVGLPPMPEGVPIDTVREWIHPDDRARVIASAQQCLATGQQIDTEARYRMPDGSWRHVLTRRSLQRAADGEPVAFVGVALDVTEQITRSQQAQELARRLEMATETTGIGVWSVEISRGTVTWNEQMRRLHGLDSGAPGPDVPTWIENFVHTDDRAAIAEQAEFRQWVSLDRHAGWSAGREWIQGRRTPCCSA